MIKVYNEKYIKAFGKNLKLHREKKTYSQRELGKISGIDFSQIGRIERGEQNTTLSSIYTLAKALELNPEELFKFDFTE